MRRAELEVNDRHEMEQVLCEAAWGTLTTQGDGKWPYSVPMNHVFEGGVIALHCAPNGKRLELLARDPRVQYSVVREHSLIPSHALGGEKACAATQFFRSVMVWGLARIVQEPAEKARLLEALMRRHQPEGRYAPLANDELYRDALAHVCVIAIAPERMTGKFKFGQNLSDEKADALVEFLKKRAEPGDRGTARWIRAMRAGSEDGKA